MQRPLFDPSKMAKPAAPAAPGALAPAAQAMSVSQLAARIASAIQQGFPASIRVVGEVSGFRERTHWYFDLKDDSAVVNCVAFASVAKKVGFTPAQGEQVVLVGRPDFYAAGGKVSLIVESMERAGAGALDQALKKLVAEVRALGWMDPARKRALPLVPRRIAVITSRTGAALQDVLVTMRRRCPCVDVLVVDVRVQGDGAADEVTHAIRRVGARAAALGVDALLVTRGGGSMEDLWAFNDKELARAIVESPVPVVAAIGHETDTTIAELVADERCATPTQAAMRLRPDRSALLRQLDAEATRLTLLAQRMLRERQARVAFAERSRIVREPDALLDAYRERLHDAQSRLASAVHDRCAAASARLARSLAGVERLRPAAVLARGRERVRGMELALIRAQRGVHVSAAHRLDALHRQLHAVSPQSVLDRGFSVTLTQQGTALRDASDARAGSVLTTRLAKGSLTSVVQGEGGLMPLPPAGPRPARAARRKASTESGPGLFG